MARRDRHDCDVLILGAGPAGCATALGLLATGIERVWLVDRPLSLPFRIGESATPDLAKLLAELGLENRLERLGHTPYHGNISLWGEHKPRVDHFLLHGRGNGWHLDRNAFDTWLQQQAVARGARLITPSAIDAIAPHEGSWLARVRGSGEITAAVVVDAAGRHSPLATRMGVRRRRLDGLVAMATYAPPARGMNGLSLVESFADGWWYAAGLPDGRTLVTLMTDRDIARERGFADPERFIKAWHDTELLSQKAPPPGEPPQIHLFAAHSGFIECAAGHRWIAVGDALMGLDPLTSSGISGALNDALAAVPVIHGQLRGDTAPARDFCRRADSTFRRYLSERRKHYAAETRWKENAFWSCRIAGPPDSARLQ